MTVSVHRALTLSNIVLSLSVCYLSAQTLAELASCRHSSITLTFVTSVQSMTGRLQLHSRETDPTLDLLGDKAGFHLSEYVNSKNKRY